jgi:hypothetical protein
MFEFKASGGKRNMHNWLQCKIHSMNRRARTEAPVHVIKLQQHNDADSVTKLYRKLHFLLSTSTVQIIHKLSSHSAVSHLKSASSHTCKCKWIAFGLRTVTKLGAELAVCASARQDGFGGLVVCVLASGSRVRGFEPGRSRWIFSV